MSQKHEMAAIDLEMGQMMNPMQKGIIDTYRSKVQMLSSAVDTVGIILRIDRVLRSSDRIARLRKGRNQMIRDFNLQELELAQKEEEEKKMQEKKEMEASSSSAMYRQRFSNSSSTITSDKNIHNSTYKRQEQQFYSQVSIKSKFI